MLNIGQAEIMEQEGTYRLPDGTEIYAKTLRRNDTGGTPAPICGDGRLDDGRTANGLTATGRTAIFIHGGGSGGNHTIVGRPARWLIAHGHFSTVIMPDRRGAARSSPISTVMSYEDNARDMQQLLDSMGVRGPVTAIGISYGGPIALTLAAIDSRIDAVLLVASSPSLQPARGVAGFLYRKGLLEKVVKGVYSKAVGKLGTAYPDFDGAYDAKGMADLKKLFMAAIQHTDRSRLPSLLLENASTCDLKNAAIDPRFRIGVPVLRVIGTRDETWAVDLGDRYREQIPDLRTRFIQNAGHKDVFFRANEFYEALGELLRNTLREAAVSTVPAATPVATSGSGTEPFPAAPAWVAGQHLASRPDRLNPFTARRPGGA